MATNDERRAVAKLLRVFARGGLWSEFSDYCNCAGPGRLADLIDPDTTGDTTKSDEDTTKGPASSDATRNCSDPTLPCDRDALLAIADELETDGVDHYTVSTQYVCDQYARRIREACGEN